MKVYALCIGHSGSSANLADSTLYKTKELARKALKKIRDEIVARNVKSTCDTPDMFSYYFGYEEHGATWFIKEIVVIEQELIIKNKFIDGYH